MNIKLITLTTCFFVLISLQSVKAQEIVLNGSAEAGRPIDTGWVAISIGTNCYLSNGWRVPGNQNGFPVAHSGTYFFYPGCGANGAGQVDELQQDVNITADSAQVDAANYHAAFSVYTQSYSQTPPDEATVKLEFRDSTNTIVLDSFSTGATTNKGAWVHYTDTRNAPWGTRYIRIRLLGTSRNGGSLDSYFDDISLIKSPVLPVNFESFTATLHNGEAVLGWRVDGEQNVKGYNVQASADGSHWQSLAFVAAQVGSSLVKNYGYTDKSIQAGTTFYRVQQVSTDAHNSLSTIRSLTLADKGQVIIYPNPSAGTIYIKNASAFGKIELVSLQGQVVKAYTTPVTSINISSLVKGIYILRLTGSSGTVYRRIEKN